MLVLGELGSYRQGRVEFMLGGGQVHAHILHEWPTTAMHTPKANNGNAHKMPTTAIHE